VKTSKRQIVRETLSTAEVAQYLGCSERFVRELMISGSLPSFKLGRLRRVRRADLDRFVERRVEEGRADRL
jgi:excisionase family DNA binding protein